MNNFVWKEVKTNLMMNKDLISTHNSIRQKRSVIKNSKEMDLLEKSDSELFSLTK